MDSTTKQQLPEQFFKSRRDLKGVACDIAHKFASSLQHYAWLARHHSVSVVTIDLFTQRILPEPFDIERNRILADMCGKNLDDLLKRLKPPAKVISAVLTAEFDIQDYIDDGHSESVGKTTVTVVLTDERGKLWAGVNASERSHVQGGRNLS